VFFVNATGGNSIYRDADSLRFATGASAGSSSGATKMLLTDAGNVGIGTTSPSTKLSVASSSSTSVVIGGHYSSSNQNNFFETGINLNDAYLILRNSGVESKVKLNSDGDSYLNGGNVGIGTNNPQYDLDIRGDSTVAQTRLGGDVQSTNLILESSDTGGAPATTNAIRFKGYEARGQGMFFEDLSFNGEEWFAGIQYSGSFNSFQIGYDFAGGQAEYAANALLTIKDTGNVGIGTTAPTAPLEVIDTSFSSPAIRITASGSSAQAELQLNRIAIGRAAQIVHALSGSDEWHSGIIRNGGGTTTGYSISTEADINVAPPQFHILTTGNIGIGTDSPASKLDVSGGDVEVQDIASGIIMKSPDGTRYRVTVANGGTLSVAAV
jgi:hypothetical protein